MLRLSSYSIKTEKNKKKKKEIAKKTQKKKGVF